MESTILSSAFTSGYLEATCRNACRKRPSVMRSTLPLCTAVTFFLLPPMAYLNATSEIFWLLALVMTLRDIATSGVGMNSPEPLNMFLSA